jgi:5-hydroxyisourate hydrolase
MSISIHLVDFMHGCAVSGVSIRLKKKEYHGWVSMFGDDVDEPGGQQPDLAAGDLAFLDSGVYRLTFDTDAYFASLGFASSYQEVIITFTIMHPNIHSVLTLIISPYGHIAAWRGDVRK